MLPNFLLAHIGTTDAVLQLDLKELHLNSPESEQRLECLASKHRSFFPPWRNAYLNEIGSHNSPTDFDELLKKQSYYLLSHKDLYVGYLELRLQTPTVVLIAEIWTAPEARGYGWAHKMLASCLHMLKQRGIHTVFMMTANPAAQCVYQKAGAKIVRVALSGAASHGS